MKIVYEVILTGFLSFFLTLILNVFIETATSKNTEVEFGPKLTMNSKHYQLIDVTNYSTNVSDLRISIPSSTNIDSIISSNPISLQIVSHSYTTNKAILISNIKASEITKIFIPLKNLINSVEIISYNDAKVVFYNSIENRFFNALINSIPLAMLVGAFSGFLGYKIIKKQKLLDTKFDENETKIKEMQIDFDNKQNAIKNHLKELQDDSIKKIKEVENASSRSKALINLKIRDYQIELSFWRNMIKQLLFSNSKSFKDAEKIIELVTEELKTYTTRKKTIQDFDTAMHYAAWIQQNTKKD